MQPPPHIRILDTRLTALDAAGLLEAIGALARSGRQAIVASGNAHAFNIAHTDPWFRGFLNSADMVRIDGFGLRAAAMILGHRLPPRSTWADFGWRLGEFAAQYELSLFFFGGRPGTAQRAAHRLRVRWPAVRIAGARHGHIDLTAGSAESTDVLDAIRDSNPHIVIVGLGMPRQERWIEENRQALGARVIMTGGGVFDFLSGDIPRAPRWMLNHGLEWLFRLWLEPRRMWQRYLVGNPLFIFRVLRERFARIKAPPRPNAPPADRPAHGARPAAGAVDTGLARWNDEMYRRHPTPYQAGVAGWIQRARVRAVYDLARIAPDDSVLEVGCEAGGLLSRLPPCRRIAGADISPAALADARRLLDSLGRKAELRELDAQAPLPFSTGEFSVIICSELLEHVPSPHRVIENLRSLCTPATRLIITVPEEALKLKVKRILRSLRLLGLLFPGIEDGRSEWHLHLFSDRMLRELLPDRFTVVRARSVWFCHQVYLCRTVEE